MDISIQERKFSFRSEYDIVAPNATYTATKSFFSFNDKLQLKTVTCWHESKVTSSPCVPDMILFLRTAGFFGIAAKSYGSVSLYAKEMENLSVSMSI